MVEFLVSVFLLSWLCQLLYTQPFAFKLVFHGNGSIGNVRHEPVSVIICTHNDLDSLKANLPYILEQKFPVFEVIVVDDASNDGTWEHLEELRKASSILKPVRILPKEKIHRGKKQALAKGIETAQYDAVLLTDADCRPASDKWIATMEEKLGNKTEIVLGHSPYRRKPGLLNALIRFEALNTAIQFMSFSLNGMPYMGTGRNLAYKKKLAKDADINQHRDLISGDDDLFINQVANKDNTMIRTSKKAIVLSEPKSSWMGYFIQKRRHFTTGIRYKRIHKVLLGLWNLSKLLFYASLVVIVVTGKQTPMIMYLAVVYFILQFIILFGVTRKLGDRDLILFAPILEVVSVFFNSFVFATLFFSKGDRWK